MSVERAGAEPHLSPSEGERSLPAGVARIDGPAPGPVVAVVARQHGNEPVGEAVVARLHAEAHRVARGALVTIVANLDARALDLRHTPGGCDMNRLWDRATLDRLAALDDVAAAGLASEPRRVRALAPILRGADVVLDLHSTSRPSTPHLIVRDDARHRALAARLGVRRIVVGVHEHAVLSGGVLSNLGLAPAEPGGATLGLTLEAGQHEDPANVEAAWRVTTRLLVAVGVWDGEAPSPDPEVDLLEILHRVPQAPRASRWTFVGWEGGPPGGGRLGPPRRLASFETVEADEIVLRNDRGDVLRADAPFVMLMPSTTAGPGEDLYFVATRRPALLAPAESDAAARAEAVAIEAVLDRLAWDEAERGTLRAPVSTERTLAVAADLVARATRLPSGHPHRRLVVVGARVAPLDADEAREARVLGAALARARAAGVPIERVVLLRGATLADLEAARQEVAEGVTVRFADRQAAGLSLVAAGDVEGALVAGDLRHVSVLLTVEAASLDDEGDDVRVHTDRAGLLGARAELLGAAVAWLGRLRAEDRHLRTELGCKGEAAVHDAVRRRVAEGWRAALRGLLPAPAVRETGTLGRWLSRVMLATGVPDAAAVRSWIVRSGPTGHTLDSRALDADPPPGLPWPASAFPPVVHAADVDADSRDRWLNARRRLSEVEALPGSRGRDLEVLVGREAVHGRVATWLADARAAGASAPGRWLVAIAGDGQDPVAASEGGGTALREAHDALVADGRVRYLRAQHARGTHLRWWRHLVDRVASRPLSSYPAGLAFDAELSGGAHVIVVASRTVDDEPTPRTLEPWTVERALLLVAAPPGDGRFHVALATDRVSSGRLHAPLAALARAHVERLLRRSSFWIQARTTPMLRVQLDAAVRDLLTAQAAQVASEAERLRALAPADRVDWVVGRLGLADLGWASAIVAGVLAGEPPDAVARRAWRDAGG